MTIFNKEVKKWYIDILAYLGLLMSGIFFLYYIGNEVVAPLVGQTIQNTGATASYLMAEAVLLIFSYCTCEDKMQSYLLLISTAMNFFVLLINKNIVSIWLMIGILLWIPVVFRPTAELIKRAMQLLFVFVFLLCNMSLITNYTSMLTVGVSYNLEISVYLEMLLALGGLLFFYYWDRLPEGTDLTKISMLKLQRRIKVVLGIYVVIFIGIIFGGSCWQNLPEEGYRTFVKGITVSLINEINLGDSLFYICVDKGGVIVFGTAVFLFYKLIKRLWRKYHPDKPVTNMLIILTVLFVLECFIWKLTFGNILLHTVFLFFAFFIYEEKREIIILQGSKNYGKEVIEPSCSNDDDTDVSLSVDDSASVCS